jgi:hypothetical protein
MCLELMYHYTTCGHIIPARDDQDAWVHCDQWAEGQDENHCPNFDDNADHETEEVDSKCQECEYLTPPTSTDSSNSDNDDE